MLATLSTTRTAHLLADGVSAHAALTSGYRLGFIVGAGLVVAAIVVALTVLKPTPKPAAERRSRASGRDRRASEALTLERLQLATAAGHALTAPVSSAA